MMRNLLPFCHVHVASAFCALDDGKLTCPIVVASKSGVRLTRGVCEKPKDRSTTSRRAVVAGSSAI